MSILINSQFSIFFTFLSPTGWQLPASGDIYGYYVDMDSRRYEPWEKIIPSFKYDPEVLKEKFFIFFVCFYLLYCML